MELISVIMAVFEIPDKNVLQKSIYSILSQSYKNIELIICDDGSKDGTFELIQELTVNDSRVILLHNHLNMGAAKARNCCIEHSSGNYIAIMDADDYSDPSRLDTQLQILKENTDISFVGTRGLYFGEKIRGHKEYWYCEKPAERDFLFTLPFVHASILFRKEVLLKSGGYSVSRSVRRSEDYDLLMRLYALGYKGYNLAAPLYFIRADDNMFRRRKYRYRFNEFIVKFNGFKNLNLMPLGIVYAVKPLVVGLLPQKVLNYAKEKYYEWISS